MSEGPLRKHSPVATTFYLTIEHNQPKKQPVQIPQSRKLNKEILQQRIPIIEEARRLMNENQLDEH